MGVEVNLVTGKKGRPHISGPDLRAFNSGITGMDGALQTGRMFSATAAAGNTITIADGDMIMQGIHWRIDEDTVKEIALSNGESGMRRCDLILAHYHINVDTGIESVELEVLEGNPTAGTPSPRTFTEGNLREGDSDARMELFRVEMNGFNVSEITPMFDHIPTLKQVSEGIKVFMGSKVCNPTTATTAIKVFTDSDIRKMVGKELTASQLMDRIFISYMNGHYEANGGAAINGSERRANSNGFYARLSGSVKGNIRINYIVVYRE